MCDNAMMSAFALDEPRIDGRIVREVCRDFDLRPAAGKPQRAPAVPAPLTLVEPVAAAPDGPQKTTDGAEGAKGEQKQATASARRFSLLGLR